MKYVPIVFWRSIVLPGLLPAIFAFSFVSPLPAEEVILAPASEADFGSGASTREDFYIPGSEGKGMFIGHPNANTRNDRALIRFDLSALSLKAEKFKKAELLIWIDMALSEEENLPREMGVEHCLDQIETLDGAAVASQNVEDVGVLQVRTEDMIHPDLNPNKVATSIPEPLRIDVTTFIKSDLEAGMTSVTFRLKDLLAEQKHNEAGGPIGILVSASPETLPHLEVELE
jgi:hypothetical protein